MPELSDFRLGSGVLTSGGGKAGPLASVLVERDGFDPKALVVEVSLEGVLSDEKLFIHNELVVPIELVRSASRERVQLSVSGEDLGQQSPYLAYRLQTPDAGASLLEETQFLGGGLGMPQ